MPWGVENLTLEQRYAKAADAGISVGGVPTRVSCEWYARERSQWHPYEFEALSGRNRLGAV